jgi:multidrug efflux system membrane fusion protein
MYNETPPHTAPRRFNRKPIALVAGALALAAIGVTSFQSHAEKPAAPAMPPPAVTVAAVIEKPVTEWDEFSGRIEAVERVEIRPRVSGTIDAIYFQEGQLVKKGDPLFALDKRPYEAELARAAAMQAGAKARLALAQTEAERSRRLIRENAVAQRELDQRENALVEAQAALQAAEAAVQTARLNLQYTTIAAPVAGRVSRAEITVGNLVASGAGAPALTTVVSVSPVYVSFELDERTFLRYAAGGAAGNAGLDRIPVAIGLTSDEGYPHPGRLKAFDNRLDTNSGTIRVRAVIDNAKGMLTPGMYARVRTGDAAEKPALLVQDRAIGTDQDKKYVMVLDNANKVTYRKVVLGPIADGLRIVRSGLARDERIVVDGLQRIRPNDVVAPKLVAMTPGQDKLAGADGGVPPLASAGQK